MAVTFRNLWALGRLLSLFCHSLVLLREAVEATSEIPSYELGALSDLYVSTQGTDWEWTSANGNPWNFSDPLPCTNSWEGLQCYCVAEGTCFIVQMDLTALNLRGSIPPSVGNFPLLQYLSMADNK